MGERRLKGAAAAPYYLSFDEKPRRDRIGDVQGLAVTGERAKVVRSGFKRVYSTQFVSSARPSVRSRDFAFARFSSATSSL